QPARKRLLGRGYGQRIVVDPLPSDGVLPYADFFANEIVVAGPHAVQPAELYRVLHPCTGRLRWSNDAEPTAQPMAAEAFARAAGAPAGEVQQGEIRRGALAGAFDWNSKTEVDQRVRWPLELLWFGGPGRERTMARHRQGLPPPVAAHGRTF